MLFSVIYSADVPEGHDVMDFAPPYGAELWDETESGETEYSHLEDEWENGTHKKWAAILTRDQFDEFVDRCELVAESTETMGSIGALGCGFWAPAISFNNRDSACIANAYVTPLQEVEGREFDENDWDRVKQAVLAVYS